METLKKFWKWIVGGVVFVLGLIGMIFYQRGKKQEAQGDLISANNNTENAVTSARKEELDKKLQEEKERLEKEKDRKLTDKEMEEYLRRL